MYKHGPKAISSTKKAVKEGFSRFDIAFQDMRDRHWMMNLGIMWKKIDMKLFHII